MTSIEVVEFIYNAAILMVKNYKKDEIMQKSIFLNRPNLVVSATDHSTLDAICKTKNNNTFDIVEIRLDQLVQEKNLKEKISSISLIPFYLHADIQKKGDKIISLTL
ncbi:MAG: hypothetical protein ACJ0IZ_03635 [Verrucomicrobiales bacterium]